MGENIIVINFCLTDRTATDSHPLGTLACTGHPLAEREAQGFKLLSRHINTLPGRSRMEESRAVWSPELPGAAALSHPLSLLPGSPTSGNEQYFSLDANVREREARKHLTLTPSSTSPSLCEFKQIIVKAKAHLWLLSRLCPSYLGSSLSLL